MAIICPPRNRLNLNDHILLFDPQAEFRVDCSRPTLVFGRRAMG
jgi:hypothetical protein